MEDELRFLHTVAAATLGLAVGAAAIHVDHGEYGRAAYLLVMGAILAVIVGLIDYVEGKYLDGKESKN